MDERDLESLARFFILYMTSNIHAMMMIEQIKKKNFMAYVVDKVKHNYHAHTGQMMMMMMK